MAATTAEENADVNTQPFIGERRLGGSYDPVAGAGQSDVPRRRTEARVSVLTHWVRSRVATGYAVSVPGGSGGPQTGRVPLVCTVQVPKTESLVLAENNNHSNRISLQNAKHFY